MRYVKWVIVLSVLWVILFPVLSVVRAGLARPADIIDRAVSLWGNPEDVFISIARRQKGVDALATLIGRVLGDEPYTGGAQLGLWAVGWVPRVLWLDKPVIFMKGSGHLFFTKERRLPLHYLGDFTGSGGP